MYTWEQWEKTKAAKGEAAANAEQMLGVIDLADPDPSPFIVFWLYTHPPVEDRIRFANSYHPWADGQPLKFVHIAP